MFQAELSGWLWMPKAAFADLQGTRERLTFVPKKRGDDPPQPTEMFAEEGDRIGIPAALGMEWFGGRVAVLDRTTRGEPFLSECERPDPNHPAVRDPAAQAALMAAMEEHVSNNPWPLRFRVEAATGTGKTVLGAWLAGGVVRRKALVLSHLSRINDQWVDAFHRLLGVPLERIGRCYGGAKEWRDRDVVVSTYQSMMNPGSWPEDFYRQFGCVVADENHRAAAHAFSRAMWQFPAAVKFGLSATQRRRDGAHVVVEAHLGKVALTGQAAALPLKVYPVWHRSSREPWGKDHGARTKCLATDPRRNARIARIVKQMHAEGRYVLVVSEKVYHLEALRELCAQAGIPEGDMGLFVAQRNGFKVEVVNGREQRVATKVKVKQVELDRVLRECRVVLATYGMVKEGVDVPRWDAGIDATPQSAAVQLVGRVRRPLPGKREPIWVTIVDERCDRSLWYYRQRLKDYEACGAEVVA